MSSTTPSASAPSSSAGQQKDMPTIAGSFWAFIGVVVGAGVIVLVLGVVGFLILRWRRKRRFNRRVGGGNNLSTSHPNPFGLASGNRRADPSSFQVLHDADENDAFAATSPRNSGTYGYGVQGYEQPPPGLTAGPAGPGVGFGGYGPDATTPATGVAFGGYGRYGGYDDAYDDYERYQQPQNTGPSETKVAGPPLHSHQVSSISQGERLPHMPTAG